MTDPHCGHTPANCPYGDACADCGAVSADPDDLARALVEWTATHWTAKDALTIEDARSLIDVLRVEQLEEALRPFAEIADRIDNFPYGGPPSPLLAVMDECRAARAVLRREQT